MTALRRQDGFGMVETLVAFFLLVVGVLATLSLLDTSRRTTFRAEQSQVINSVGQRELEDVRALDYDQIALTAMPSQDTSANHPGSRVTSTGKFDLDNDLSTTADQADLVVNGGSLEEGGQVAGGQVGPSESFTIQDGDIAGTIFRYVVWRDDPKCQLTTPCEGTQDFKRVVVAVKVDEAPVAGFDRAYQEFHTDVIDPDATALSSDPAGGGVPTTAQQFWLSDQRCRADAGEPAAANPSGDHHTHDTTGSCGGLEGQRPDALIGEAPPDPDPLDASNPPQWDYASESVLEPDQNPDKDKGLQMFRQESNGCAALQVGTDAHQKIHWWDTRQLIAGGGGNFVMTGASTLELWTRTINDAQVPGAICVYVRRRPLEVDLLSTPIAVPLVSISSPTSGFSCSVVSSLEGTGKCASTLWPYGSWQKLRINLQTSPDLVLGLYDRLEIGISIERGDTPQNALQFLYDHPTYDSRWEIITTTPL